MPPAAATSAEVVDTGMDIFEIVGTGGDNDLKDIHAGVHLGGVVAHGGGAARNFVRGLSLGALGGKRRQKSCVLGGSGLAAHDLVHHGIGFVVAQVLLVDDLHNGFLDHFLTLHTSSSVGRIFMAFSLPVKQKLPRLFCRGSGKEKRP